MWRTSSCSEFRYASTLNKELKRCKRFLPPVWTCGDWFCHWPLSLHVPQKLFFRFARVRNQSYLYSTVMASVRSRIENNLQTLCIPVDITCTTHLRTRTVRSAMLLSSVWHSRTRYKPAGPQRKTQQRRSTVNAIPGQQQIVPHDCPTITRIIQT